MLFLFIEILPGKPEKPDTAKGVTRIETQTKPQIQPQTYPLTTPEEYIAQQELCPLGFPDFQNKEADKYRILVKTSFVIGHSGIRRQPLWVAYRVTDEYANLPKLGKRRFKADSELPEDERAFPSDYKDSGFDRVHLAPLASTRRPNNPKPDYESCLLSNISPQKPSLNQKIWRLLEEKVREWAKKNDVFVFTGTIFNKDNATLPSGRVMIPKAFFKIVYRRYGWIHTGWQNAEVLSFVMNQNAGYTEEDKKLTKFLKSVDEVEEITGFDFFIPLTDEIEDKIESHKPTEIWE